MSDEEWKLGKEEPLKLIQDRKCPAYILQSIPVIGWNIYILFFKFHILLKKRNIQNYTKHNVLHCKDLAVD